MVKKMLKKLSLFFLESKLNFIKILTVILLLYTVQSKIVRRDDICGEFNGRRMYLELGENGIITAKNASENEEQESFRKNDSSPNQCSLELVTCPSCIIFLKFSFLNISQNCGKNSALDSCGCEHVWMYEPPFAKISSEQYCGYYIKNNDTSLFYKSKTRTVAVKFVFNNFIQNAFTLEYSSERNRQFINGFPNKTNSRNASQIISSPYFPNLYPRDLSTEYTINCKGFDRCLIRLLFTDFQLSRSSVIEFFDWNGQPLDVATGSSFRPPILISHGPTLVIRFYANGGTNIGFRALFDFLLDEIEDVTLKPNTDCGGYVDNLGGAITMMDMLDEGKKSYDCFWIIQPPPNYLHLQTHLYLKIVSLANFAGNTELVVRQGITSNEPVLEIVHYPLSRFFAHQQVEHVVSISKGFYVSLKGLFGPESSLAIIYATFSYKECVAGSDFLCQNHRCIPAYLHCDGFDHCGDNSDEETCNIETSDQRRSHVPNFFFPKIDRYSDLQTATIVFTTCCLGLLALVFALIVLICRISTRTHRHTVQNNLQTISHLLEEGTPSIQEEIIPDEPPHYEFPPNYEEVLKINHEKSQRRSQRKLARNNTVSRSRSSSERRQCSRCSLRLSLAESGGPMSLVSSANRSCQTTPLPIPESPPPAYSCITNNFPAGAKQIQSMSSEEFVPKNDDESMVAVPSPAVKHFYDGNFNSVIRGISQIPKKCKAKKTLQQSYETYFNRRSSDSELWFDEDKTAVVSVPIPKLRRSFSFENLKYF